MSQVKQSGFPMNELSACQRLVVVVVVGGSCQRDRGSRMGGMCRAAVDPTVIPNGVTERAEWLLLLINHKWMHPLP